MNSLESGVLVGVLAFAVGWLLPAVSERIRRPKPSAEDELATLARLQAKYELLGVRPHCPACHRPLPHTPPEQAACPAATPGWDG